MKNRLLLPIFALFTITILISCDDSDNGKRSEITLDKNTLITSSNRGDERIELTANGEWKLKECPEWITVDPEFGESSAQIIISITENKEFTRREANLVFISGDASKILKVEQLSLMDLDPFIEFSENTLSISTTKESKKIKVTSNTPWKIKNIPTWISIYPTSGDKSTEITVTVDENYMPNGRDTQIEFVASENTKKALAISQYGLKDIIVGPIIPIFRHESIKFTGALDNYEVKTNRLFVNPGIRNKIYLGNLLSHNAQPHTNIPEFTGYTFSPITISTGAAISGEIVKTYIPSLTEQDDFAKYIAANNPAQNESFITDNGTTTFYSYKRLHTLGMANFGVKLDELVTGSSFTEREMDDRYGVIYSYKQILFNLVMDIPYSGTHVKEEIKEADKAKGISYVSSVDYGKVGLLIVESYTDSRIIKDAIDKVLADESLSQEETALIQSADISYVYFNTNNEPQVKKGNTDVINAYKKALTNKGNIYPVQFELANLNNHSTSTMTFSFKVPE